ncbi:hypothetical protein [Nodularia sphaerocarpa]|uniref:hypothetical protein n=1 Tax=Nodularia sphaerocarpa TaxID=137816 RepID=UPI001EFC28BE|nr:hypothetical protein [Nodularia sphaerocarpa]ULP71459.1 hypothetical protein BDGGKGIB_01085 [Nodularia sphaerocarpa UHCC 0038]ULP73413.1 hypothetical protein BDGGKGIB_03066 [Nodularia sphaerocarpa UHCC 0038]
MDNQTEQQPTEELDLGLEAITPDAPEIDYEAALAKTKPDFQRIAKLLGIKPSGSCQAEVEADFLAKQKSLESELKETLVPKIQAALQGALSKNSDNKGVITKPGVSTNKASTIEERRVKPWRGY